jgi:hypothetical protein
MKRHHIVNRLVLGMLICAALFLGMNAPAAAAQEKAESAVITSSDVDCIIAEELNKHLGGWASLTLNSGAVFSGTIMKLRGGMVHISKIQNKEYYEALIRISDISAIGARFRSTKEE